MWSVSKGTSRKHKKHGKDIVFLPYKASAWDSMESIWRAAVTDGKHCNAYVVPIPYCEKNEDGTPREWFCETDQFPKEVHALDWREVDLEVMHPDIIFIHYPYDHQNFVTDLPEKYCSGQLKNVTDLLVYVDYGIPVWTPRDAESFDPSSPGATTMWVHWHADVIVAYSREFAGLIDRLMEAACPVLGDMAYREVERKKVVALGSAKFDKVLSVERQEVPLPEAWRRRIGGRKILLFNLSLTGLGWDTMLEDIRNVIDTVAPRDDVVLWWRPHPLVESTLRRLAPEFVDGYRDLVTEFREKGLGIYDDTADFHRALAWSDGCLTTESSLSWLCLATGKPFTIYKKSRLRPGCKRDEGKTFREPLLCRIANMEAGKGANLHPEHPHWNFCVWWDNFLPEDLLHNIYYENFLERFLHFIVHPEEYPEAKAYRGLQRQIFRDFAVNPDGTAGRKIYEYCMRKKGRVP